MRNDAGTAGRPPRPLIQAAPPAGGSTATHSASGLASSTAAVARVPSVARRVQCPVLMAQIGHLPDSPVQPLGPVEPAESVPPGFKPVAVVQCVTAISVKSGSFRLAQRKQAAVTGLGSLLAALRKPSTPRPKGALPACMVPANSGPWFVLVSATGQVIRPLVPVGLCGGPVPAVLASLHSLHWITLSTTSLPGGTVRPPLHGGPVHDITPAITAPQAGSAS